MFRKLAPALVAPLLLASACAQASDGDALRVDATGTVTPIQALRAAPDLAAEVSTAQVELTMAIEAPDGTFEMHGEGAYDTDAGLMRMTMDMGDFFRGLAEAEGEELPPGFDEPMEVVVADGVTYLRIPFLQGLTGQDGWLSATPEDLGQSGGSLGLPTGGTDPTQLLESLRGTGEVTEAGTEDVRGVPTTRYDVSIDLATALEQAPVDQRERLEAQLDELGGSVEDLPMSVWIDDDGLARRIRVEADATSFGGTAADGRMTMSIEFFAYGEPVEIDVPPADEVTSFTDLLGSFGGALGSEAS